MSAQHHGVPTRLLDWSYSPLIAAHFATLAGPPDSDKVVWRLNWRLVHEHFGLPPVAFLVQDLDAMLQARGIASLGELMARPHLGDARFVCMLDPPALDDRIIAQSATFTISTDKTRSFEQILGEEGLSHALTRYVIPKERLNYVRDQLDLCALDERKLFPRPRRRGRAAPALLLPLRPPRRLRRPRHPPRRNGRHGMRPRRCYSGAGAAVAALFGCLYGTSRGD